MRKLKSALVGLLALTVSPVLAQDAGVFEKFLQPEVAAECYPVSEFSAIADFKVLTSAQFQFIRALYVSIPPVSREFPPGDYAFRAEKDGKVMLGLASFGQDSGSSPTDQSCARFLAPDFILKMLEQIARGENGKPVGEGL
jgi:hypothetical protein